MKIIEFAFFYETICICTPKVGNMKFRFPFFMLRFCRYNFFHLTRMNKWENV